MTEVLLFHHALGQTQGFLAFADDLRDAGHTVHTPDLYDGKTFTALGVGVAYAERVGFDAIIQRGVAAAAELPPGIVYAGMSLGNLPAQILAQTCPGARGALLLYGGEPTSAFKSPWPDGVPLQIHAMDGDAWVELDVFQKLADEIANAELFVYPGDGHLFAETGQDDYNPEAAALLKERVLGFLDRVS